MTALLSRLIALLLVGLLTGLAQAQQQGTADSAATPSNDLAAPSTQDTPQPATPQPAAIHVDITDMRVGTGAEVADGDTISVHYTGYLFQPDRASHRGKKFDSSYDRGKPISFTMGAHRVIAGWETGLLGMKVGGRRTLVIPPELAYGAKGVAGFIPADATLVFDVDLISVKNK